MSFRIEEKLFINRFQVLEFEDYLLSKKAIIQYPKRIIKLFCLYQIQSKIFLMQ